MSLKVMLMSLMSSGVRFADFGGALAEFGRAFW